MSRGRIPGAEEIDWVTKFDDLTGLEKKELLSILCENRTQKNLTNSIKRNKNIKLKNILDHYLPRPKSDEQLIIGEDLERD
jgi:hypothetical protein